MPDVPFVVTSREFQDVDVFGERACFGYRDGVSRSRGISRPRGICPRRGEARLGIDARRIHVDDILLHTLALASQSEQEPVIKA